MATQELKDKWKRLEKYLLAAVDLVPDKSNSTVVEAIEFIEEHGEYGIAYIWLSSYVEEAEFNNIEFEEYLGMAMCEMMDLKYEK